jgi:hypothetical protein
MKLKKMDTINENSKNEISLESMSLLENLNQNMLYTYSNAQIR